jgi:protein-tyrosine sulfotransferase
VGSHRSGSTLLRFILDSHPNLACPPESKFLAALPAILRYPQVERAFASLGFDRPKVAMRLRAFVESFLDDYAAACGKRRWVDKTPNYHKIVDFIDEIFEGEVLYIVIVRNPLDSVASLDEMVRYIDGRGGSLSHEDPEIVDAMRVYGATRQAWAMLWKEAYETIRHFTIGRPERMKVIRYEDLVVDCQAKIAEVLNFLGEPVFEDLVVKAFAQRHRAGYQDLKILSTREIHGKSIDRWRQWPPDEIDALWRIVEPVAVEYGYTALPPADLRIGAGA